MAFGVPNPNPFGLDSGTSASSSGVRGGKIIDPLGQLPINNPFGSGSSKPSYNLGVNFQINPHITLFAKTPGATDAGDPPNGGSGGSGGSGGKGRPRRGGRKKEETSSVPSFSLEERGSLPVDWNTGISSGLLHNNVQSGESGYSTLYLSFGQLFPGNSKDDPDETLISGLLDNELYQCFKNTVAQNNTITSARYFLKSDFLQYIKLIIDILQIYYSLVTPLTLYENKDLENTGIYSMRQRIDEHVASSLMKLEYELQKHSCPPQVVAFIRAMYQAYTPSMEKNAPIYMLSYKSLWLQAEDDSCIEGSIESNVIDDLIKKLNNSKFSDFRTIYAEAIPSHLIKLEPSYNVPIYSEDFITMWHNQTINYSIPEIAEEKVLSTCNVTDSQTSFKFFTSKDEYDASFLALKTVYKEHKYSVGLWRPISQFHNVSPTNYMSMARLNGGVLCNNMTDQLTSACGILRVPVYNVESKDFDTTYRPGAGFRKAMYCTEELVELAVQSTTRYLFGIDKGKVSLNEKSDS